MSSVKSEEASEVSKKDVRFRGFTRHFEISGDLLTIREGTILPDVCLYSGKVGKGLARTAKQLCWVPQWAGYVFVLAVMQMWVFKSGLGIFVGLILILPVMLLTRKSALVHFAYSRLYFLCRSILAIGIGVVMYLALKVFSNYYGEEPWVFFPVLIVTFGLIFMVSPKLQGLRVKSISGGQVTLVRVHPAALQVLKEIKEAASEPQRSGGALRKTQ
ncbi:MAG: hypothetical protein ACI9NQ_001983 [Paracoccaceae bacterium]|jgi:hypothetical protein